MKRAFMISILAVTAAASCAGPGDFSGGLCGNGNLNFGEDCDGELFANDAPYTCVQLGYNSPGRAACGPDCQIDPSPCLSSGMCGDGFATPFWEACDGKDNGGETCASLGFHGGRLFCRDNCQFDISQCERCGDGVVQPQYGEVMESGSGYCLDAGWFGGAMYTVDCVTPSEDRCGDYALLEPAGSATRPVVTLRPGGDIWVTGRATGSYPGFPDPRSWCPALTQVYDLSTEPPRVVAWRHDPICEREFLATRAPGAVEEILYQREEEAPVVRQVDLGEAGRVVLRQSGRSLRLERLDLTGALLVSSRLELGAMFASPRLDLLDNGKVGVSSFDLEGLGLAVYDPATGAVRLAGLLEQVLAEGAWYRPDPTSAGRVVWVSEREWYVLAKLVAVDGSDSFTAFLRLDALGGPLQVRGVTRVLPLPANLLGAHLVARVADGRLELTWARFDAGFSRVSRVILSLEGTELGASVIDLPSGSRVEALFVEDDGSVILAGVAPSSMDPDPSQQRCRPAETALARWRLDPGLRLRDTRHFRTTAARWDFTGQPDFCNGGARTWDYRDGTLAVAGAYPRREGFCSDRDRPPLEKTLPVHTCGIYLVKFE
jgi:hypothetical protein